MQKSIGLLAQILIANLDRLSFQFSVCLSISGERLTTGQIRNFLSTTAKYTSDTSRYTIQLRIRTNVKYIFLVQDKILDYKVVLTPYFYSCILQIISIFHIVFWVLAAVSEVTYRKRATERCLSLRVRPRDRASFGRPHARTIHSAICGGEVRASNAQKPLQIFFFQNKLGFWNPWKCQ